MSANTAVTFLAAVFGLFSAAPLVAQVPLDVAAQAEHQSHGTSERASVVSATPADPAQPCVSSAAFDEFKGSLSSRWSLQGGKEDSVTPKDFPSAPGQGTALDIWATNIAGTLRSVLNEHLSHSQQQEFVSLENANCPSGRVYCQIAFRQSAVLMLLPK